MLWYVNFGIENLTVACMFTITLTTAETAFQQKPCIHTYVQYMIVQCEGVMASVTLYGKYTRTLTLPDYFLQIYNNNNIMTKVVCV